MSATETSQPAILYTADKLISAIDDAIKEHVPAIAAAALAAFAEAAGHTPIMDGDAVALVGPLAGYAVAWKWTRGAGLSYSVRSMTGRFILTLQHPTPAAAYAEAMARLDAAELSQ